jgi:hypothetical protein
LDFAGALSSICLERTVSLQKPHLIGETGLSSGESSVTVRRRRGGGLWETSND